ncbi:hypothetical protein ACFL6D_01800 [Spirochaetota bacterium]
MKNYDLVFIGQLCYDEIIHKDGSSTICTGGAALYGAIAASVFNRKLAAVIKCAPESENDLHIFKEHGIDVYTASSPETTHVQVLHKSHNIDEREIITLHNAGPFTENDIPDISAAHVHLAGCNDHDFDLDFIRSIKKRFASVSVDMQTFIRYNDPGTGHITFGDDPDKKEVLSFMSRGKLDIVEAKLLTGTDTIEEAAKTVISWGCPEVLITRSDGAFVMCDNKTYFEIFSNKSSEGRTGRGDTTFGTYLACRIAMDIERSLQYAAALVSIKMENPGPFAGTKNDVEDRIRSASS